MPRKHLLPKRAKVKRAGKKGEEGRSNPQHEQQGVPYNLPKQKSRRQPPCCCACLFGFAKNPEGKRTLWVANYLCVRAVVFPCGKHYADKAQKQHNFAG